MKSQPTTVQNAAALHILLRNSHEKFTARFVTQETRETSVHKANEWWLLPAFVVDGRYWCGWDVYYGHDIVIDLEAKTSETSKQGIFTDTYVFLSDYYGYPKGAFYYVSN